MSYPMGYSGCHGDEDWREDDSCREQWDEQSKAEYEDYLDAQELTWSGRYPDEKQELTHADA